MSGTFLLRGAAFLAILILLLGFIPWSKPATFWRPADPRLAAAATHFEAETIAKGRAFRSSGYNRYFVRKGIVGLLLVAAIALGGHLRLRNLPLPGGITAAVAAALLVLLALDVVSIPFGLAGLANARRYGISTQSIAFWFADHGKGLGIFLLTSALVLAALLALMRRFPTVWPLPATLLAGAGGVFMALILPLAVDPMFNTFTPLKDPGLTARFLEIASRAGVPAQEVLVSNASIRTTAVNAYFTGFGPTRRIVVYDTLLSSLTPKEGELVLAHEAGHWSKGHITWGLILGTLGIGVALFGAQRLLAAIFRANAFGLRGPLDPAAAPLFILLYWFGTFASLPIENAVSRRMETEADMVALELTNDPAAQVSTEISISRKNLNDLVPPPIIEALLYTHPNTMDRIAQAEKFSRKDASR